jgi:predicted ribosome quality control (RQC) complex YloA/Tae2 family protein
MLLDAAHLALHHSTLKAERRGEVGYTQAKYIRRLKGEKPGTVNVTRERTLMVELEPERMQRLLKSRTTS